MPAELRQLEWKTTYRSDVDSILRDFYVPALSIATRYQRSVGYFTSTSLAQAARGISALIEGGGTLQLIASPVLPDEDVEAINRGYDARDEVIRRAVLDAFELTESALVRSRLEALAWLIAEHRLDVKLAFRTDDYGRFRQGIYHEKIGVIHDRASEFVSFAGSANESLGGLVTNFESIPVHWSWDDPQGRATEIAENFGRLWDNDTRGLRVIPFTDVATELLERYKASAIPYVAAEITAEEDAGIIAPVTIQEKGGLALPKSLSLRDYQSDVVTAWFRNNGRGLYSLATGTGKTITALATATRLRVAGRLSALLVLCPYQNLVTQWAQELRLFGATPILAFRSREHWHAALAGELAQPRGTDAPLLVVVATFATLGTQAFQDLLPSFPQLSMLIADEAHHVGAVSLHGRLPPSGFPFRLGLSATPERWHDDDGTERILDWFGPVLEPVVAVSDAISMGALCPYNYHPVFVPLDELETERYHELTVRIARLLAEGHSFATSPQLGQILRERAAFIGTVKGKSSALRSLVGQLPSVARTLVYCGAGSIDLDDHDELEDVRHVDHILGLLGSDLGLRVAKYTAETSIADREAMIRQLVTGDLQAVVAINCLDEGVDIPCIENAIILSSSTNPRQFVQRRGRVLRTFSGKSNASIYDMIVVPNSAGTPNDAERSLMQRELRRYLEFARAALNGIEAESQILPIQERYGLLHL